MPTPLFVWAERMAPKLESKHWAAVAKAALYGTPYVCSDFENGEISVSRCDALLAVRRRLTDSGPR